MREETEPLEVSHLWNINEEIMTRLVFEGRLLHLDLDDFGGMLDDLGNRGLKS